MADLSLENRQELVEEFFEVATQAYTPAWFEPGVRYTLRTNAEISVWDSTFTSNELGYRAGAVQKRPDTFRVVFVGDSWTYGMGVDAEDSFPYQFQRLANEVYDGHGEIEAWSLALPGYNTMTEVNALEIFLNRLEPDAVVFVQQAMTLILLQLFSQMVRQNGPWDRTLTSSVVTIRLSTNSVSSTRPVTLRDGGKHFRKSGKPKTTSRPWTFRWCCSS
ncbi:MAG: SGNH/GDSL hydrolase family protein [bacterium]|nr:SGNH/GDSL hydrolase family protein [bacterium]